MKIMTREKTKAVSLEVTDIPSRVYIKAGQGEIWISTSYNQWGCWVDKATGQFLIELGVAGLEIASQGYLRTI